MKPALARREDGRYPTWPGGPRAFAAAIGLDPERIGNSSQLTYQRVEAAAFEQLTERLAAKRGGTVLRLISNPTGDAA